MQPGPSLLACGLLAFLAGAPAQASSRNVKASLVSETASLRPGQPVTLGLRLQMADGWHTYWKNPADSGLPTKLKWSLPEGFAAGEIGWPHPERISAPPLMSYGYEGEVVLPVVVTVPAALAVGEPVRLTARADWLECKEICLPGKADLELTLPVGTDEPKPSQHAALFARSRSRMPGDGAAWKVRALGAPGRHVLTFAAAAAPRDAYFFSDAPQVVEHAAPQRLARMADGYFLELTPAANGPAPERLTGVLVAENGGEPIAIAVDAALEPASAVPAGTAVRTGPTGLWRPLLFAFVGGLILNLMPCVLPVLSLKIMGFVRQAGERRVWRHGVAFTAGVLASFWAVAGLLLALRAGGERIGWGFQLQSPVFVAVLAVLFLLIALNLLGVFEVGMSLVGAGNALQGRSGLASSFWSGLLATVVATPCTAPFMGSALGFALAQPPASAMLVFTALGLGMAAPYLVLSASPGLLKFVPKPGAWMETFKELMAVPMLATVVFLCWLLGRQTGVDGMAWLLAALIPVGFGAWLYGRAARAAGGGRPRLLPLCGAAVLVIAGLALAVTRATVPVAAAVRAEGTPDALGWEPFSVERRDALLAEGTPVFIDFTAAWCLSCQVNERVALETPAVRERLRAHGVALLKADWTMRDDRISAALTSYGREGVPLYVLYGRERGAAPVLLPEVLTPGIVLGALEKTLGAQAADAAAPAR
jgi:thiol:disulfide interchange protein/DsbC/DsbD-like thiol-disulfide interchange protein